MFFSGTNNRYLNLEQTLELNEVQQAKHLVVRKCIESDDKLFHSALYNWYIEQGLVEELLHVIT